MPCFRVIAKFLTCKVHKFTGKSYGGKQSLPPSLFCIKIALVLWRICMGFQNKTFRHRKKVCLLKGWFYFLWSLLGDSSRTVWGSARGNASKAKGEFSSFFFFGGGGGGGGIQLFWKSQRCSLTCLPFSPSPFPPLPFSPLPFFRPSLPGRPVSSRIWFSGSNPLAETISPRIKPLAY